MIQTAASSRARTCVLLLGLTAVIIGILGMHIWIGSHNQGHRTPVPSIAAAPETGHHSGAAAAGAVMTETGGNAHMAAPGCAACGEHEMTAGLCVLALLVVGAIALVKPGSGVLLSAASLRGPPRMTPARTAPLQPPSLTQLSICRT